MRSKRKYSDCETHLLQTVKHHRWRRGVCAAAMAWLLLSVASVAVAADVWPSRPVRIVVAQARGGPPDAIARFIAEPLGNALGVPVIVDNRPGASGIVGIESASNATPDGYTLVIGTLSTHALVPQTSANVPYDPVRDFTPIANLFRSIKVLWINAALPVQTAANWITYARARPGALNFASGGIGSSNHIDMELFNTAAGLDVVHVPYNGPSAAITSVAAGDTQAMIVSIGSGLPLAQSGRIRPLLLFGDRRSPLLADVPIASEQELGQVDLSAWIGILAPAQTPESIVARINSEITRILQMPETTAWANRQGLEIIGGSPGTFAATIKADYRRWGEIVRRLKVQAQ